METILLYLHLVAGGYELSYEGHFETVEACNTQAEMLIEVSLSAVNVDYIDEVFLECLPAEDED